METVTISVPATAANRYGDLEPDWSDTTDTDVSAIVYPTTSTEDNANRAALVTGLSMIVADDVTVPHTARVTARGETWEVDGDVADWSSPWGWDPGRVVNLRRVEG